MKGTVVVLYVGSLNRESRLVRNQAQPLSLLPVLRRNSKEPAYDPDRNRRIGTD